MTDEMSIEEYLATLESQPRKGNKYNAKRVLYDGYWFDSQAEANRYRELALMQIAGEIARLELQPEYILLAGFTYRGKRESAIKYRADFRYFRLSDGVTVVEDVKGMKTPVYLLKRKMLLSQLAASGEHVEFVEVMRERRKRKR